MPKKTRKHKLHAQARRKPLEYQLFRETSSSPKSKSNSSSDVSSELLKAPKQMTHTTPSVFVQDTAGTHDFSRDLTKSLFIMTCIVLIQVGLYVSAYYKIFDISSVIRF